MERPRKPPKAARPAPRHPGDARLADLVVQRTLGVITRAVSQVDDTVLARALAAPTDVGSLAEVLSAVRAGEAVTPIDPLAAAMMRGVAEQDRLLQLAGGAVGVTAVARMLGISAVAVDKRRRAGALLALPSGSGDWRYPLAQFAPDGTGPLPGLREWLSAFQGVGPWTKLAYLVEPLEALGGRPTRELLAAGELARARELARHAGEHAA